MELVKLHFIKDSSDTVWEASELLKLKEFEQENRRLKHNVELSP
ncbi:hypothetical protein [Fulvivirga marina]|nr:hypothetical protein [Fulvivirga marina]